MEMLAAEAAVSFAVEKLGEALINKVAFLCGVEEQVTLLKGELEMMYGFLQDATQKQAVNEGIRVWISQIRDVAHNVEDVIETFSLKIDTPRRRRGELVRCACFPCHVYHLDKLGKEIESIRATLTNIDERRKRLDIQDLREGPELRKPQNIALQQRRLVPQQKDKDVVGLDRYIECLLGEAILNDRPGLSIARITGIGGLGKSTLAREVYNHAAVVARFKSRAWVVFSEDFDPKGVIRKLLEELGGSGGDMEKSSLEDLKGKLWERLRGRHYFIVVDDVWEQQHWDLLADAFPDEQEKSSRLLVTSRKQNIPNTARFASELQPLDPEMSWQLFLKKTFIDDTHGGCPPELEDIGRQIVEKCGGLPLAITVVGGLLLSEGKSPRGGLLANQRHSRQRWERILNGLNSDLSQSGNRVSAVLELSYHNLPPRLKACFLCLGFFREDATIPAEKLEQVWIAQGLISEEGSEETMEEIASGYLDELINQNLVQVKDTTKDGERVESCQIHDLLRELSIKKAKEEIGFEILKEGIHSQSSEKSRHHAIYCSTSNFTSLVCPNNKHIRSLFFHQTTYIYPEPSLYWKKLVLLRILDFEDFELGNLPTAIGTLIGLRYLGLRHTSLRKLPISIGCLVNLQVLDMRDNPTIKVPNIMWKLERLRHLYMPTNPKLDGPLRLDTLKNLQTFDMWDNEYRMRPKHIIEMTNLRKLHAWIRKEDVSEFISSLAKLKNLVCLKLVWSYSSFSIPISNLDVLSSLHNLTELDLWGELVSPFRDIFPPNLSQLTLNGTKIDQDWMRVLEKLTNLLYLNLKDGSYVGREMVISDDAFPGLRVLCISQLELRKIELVGEGRGMPELKRFEIYNCLDIESLPERMASLQELEIKASPKIESFMERMTSLQQP